MHVLYMYCIGVVLVLYWYFTGSVLLLHWYRTGTALALHGYCTSAVLVLYYLLCTTTDPAPGRCDAFKASHRPKAALLASASVLKLVQ